MPSPRTRIGSHGSGFDGILNSGETQWGGKRRVASSGASLGTRGDPDPDSQRDDKPIQIKEEEEEVQEAAGPATETEGKPHGYYDMYTILQNHHEEDETLDKLWKEVNAVPDWIDWEEIERGQRFFYRYTPANITGFALQGFIGENTAASGVVEVLVRTGGFSTRALLRRLLCGGRRGC